MGWVMIHAKSGNQQLNTKISTKAEIVVLSGYLPYNIHLVSFMKEQGCEFNINNLLEDNQSSIRMYQKVRNSRKVNSRHVNIH